VADDMLLELLVLVSVLLFPIMLDEVDVEAICLAVEGDGACSVD
jgi:hypothetical protein